MDLYATRVVVLGLMIIHVPESRMQENHRARGRLLSHHARHRLRAYQTRKPHSGSGAYAILNSATFAVLPTSVVFGQFHGRIARYT